MLNILLMINIQGIKLYLHDVVKNIFIIAVHSDMYEPICFKISMMLEATKLYSMIPPSLKATDLLES